MNENQKKHLDSRFYKEAKNYRDLVTIEQILKGAEKYKEPLNPRSWTVKQLVEHAMQENVDQGHYIYAIQSLIESESRERDFKLDAVISSLRFIQSRMTVSDSLVVKSMLEGSISILKKIQREDNK